jgi:hypothetical protein
MTEGDNCPECHLATVVALPATEDGEFSIAEIPMPAEFKKIFEGLSGVADRDERMLKLRERQVVALENISRDLDRIAAQLELAGEWAAAITAVTDHGEKTIRVTGEFVGGDGDVTAGV